MNPYALLQRLPMGVMLVDAELRVHFVNAWLLERLPKEDHQVVGQRLPDLFPDLEQRGLHTAIDQVLDTGTPLTLSSALHRYFVQLPPSRQELPYMFQRTTLIPVERPVQHGLLILIEDVSDQVVTERAYRQQIARLYALHQVDLALTELDKDACLRTVVLQTARLFNARLVSLTLKDQGCWQYVRGQGEVRWRQEGGCERRGVTGRVMESRQPWLVPVFDEQADLRPLEDAIRCEMAAPLVHREQLVGVLSVASEQEQAYTSEDLDVLTMLATRAVLALHNAELHTHEVRQREMAETLRDIGLALTTRLEPEVILDVLLDAVGRVVPFDSACVTLLKGDAVFMVRWRGYERFGPVDWVRKFRVPLTKLPNLVHMYRTHKPRFIPDVQSHPEWVTLPEVSYVRSWVGAPILSRGRVLGFLMLDSTRPGFYQEEHAEALAVLAAMVGVALENALLYKQQKKLAVTDGLTGLANRRRFDEELEREVARGVRFGRPVSLLMLDLDDFKLYNDTFGHPAGDEVLRALAQVMRRNLRTVDVPARYGGEEFAVILPETGLTQAVAVARRLRQQVQQMHLPFALRRPVTVSIGVASVPQHAVNAADLLVAADTALYVAKREGKNCVVAYMPGMVKEQEAA